MPILRDGRQIMEENNQQIFRKQTLDRISSPEQLTDYLKVTNPGIWAILGAVILLLAGLLVWSAVGTLETTEDVKVVVAGGAAEIISNGQTVLQKGMILRVSGEEYTIESSTEDEYGRVMGKASVSLQDGKYDGSVVTDSTRPIDFLLESR